MREHNLISNHKHASSKFCNPILQFRSINISFIYGSGRHEQFYKEAPGRV